MLSLIFQVGINLDVNRVSKVDLRNKNLWQIVHKLFLSVTLIKRLNEIFTSNYELEKIQV